MDVDERKLQLVGLAVKDWALLEVKPETASEYRLVHLAESIRHLIHNSSVRDVSSVAMQSRRKQLQPPRLKRPERLRKIQAKADRKVLRRRRVMHRRRKLLQIASLQNGKKVRLLRRSA